MLKIMKQGDYYFVFFEGITVIFGKDNKDVFFLMNVYFFRGDDCIFRKKQDGIIYLIIVLFVVKDYNNNMGVIDKND